MTKLKEQKDCTCFNIDKVNQLRKLSQEMDFGQIPKTFKAIGHERRLMTLYLISKGELCVCDLAHTLGAPVPTVSQYLRILKEAGLIVDEQSHKFLIYKLTQLGKQIIREFIDE